MASSGLASLVRILGGGFQGVSAGLDEAEDRRQKQQSLDESRQYRDASLGLQQQDLDERRRQHAQATAPLDFSAFGGSPTQDPRTANPALQWIFKQGELKREQQEREGLQAAIRGLGPTVTQADSFGDVGGSAEPARTVQRPSRAHIAATLAPFKNATPDLYKFLGGDHEDSYLTVGDRVFNRRTGAFIEPPRPPQTFTPPSGSRPVPTVDAKGGISTRYEPQPWQHDLARRALADMGWRENMPGYNVAFFDTVSSLTPITDGGGAATRSQGVPRPPGAHTPGAQSPAAPTPLAIRGPMRQPPPAEREKLAEWDAKTASARGLLDALKKPEIQSILGPVATNPLGALRRGLGNYLDVAMTKEQRQFLAQLANETAEIKRFLVGAAQTVPELRGLSDTLPDKGQIDAAVVAKLSAILQALERNRAAFANVLSQSGVAVPAPMSPPAVIRFDAAGNRIQ